MTEHYLSVCATSHVNDMACIHRLKGGVRVEYISKFLELLTQTTLLANSIIATFKAWLEIKKFQENRKTAPSHKSRFSKPHKRRG